VRWTVVIPAKALPEAKSRLAPASSEPAAHHRLVAAIRADTISSAQAATGVARVLVVADRAEAGADLPAGIDVFVQHAAGLNAALGEAAEHAARQWPADGVAALVGDLPALRPDELAAALRAAATVPAAYVADAEGTGTTLLTAAPGTPLRPGFGPGSARRHAGHAVSVPGGAGLRRDVDTAQDLDDAAAVGLGPATASALAENGLALDSSP
jgi:2-phospho-L-lactate guanylyltransferase